jgi:hypothetical protein
MSAHNKDIPAIEPRQIILGSVLTHQESWVPWGSALLRQHAILAIHSALSSSQAADGTVADAAADTDRFPNEMLMLHD